MSILELVVEMSHRIECMLESLEYVSGKDIGLDERVGNVWIDVRDNLVIVEQDNLSQIKYYGGFEYISSDVISVGDYTIFQDHERVTACIEFYNKHNQQD